MFAYLFIFFKDLAFSKFLGLSILAIIFSVELRSVGSLNTFYLVLVDFAKFSISSLSGGAKVLALSSLFFYILKYFRKCAGIFVYYIWSLNFYFL